MTPSARSVAGSSDLVFAHRLARALDHSRNARLADEHVVRLLGQHELRRPRERIEA